MIRVYRTDQAELYLFDAQMMLGLIIKIFQRLSGKRSLAGFAVYAEVFSAACYGNLQYRLDLSEIFIKRTAQVGKTLIIGGRKGNFDGF